MSNQAKLKEIVRELIKKEVEEASTSSATPGYQTPMAFSGGRKKDKDKKKKIANAAGYNVVKEVKIGRYDIGMGSLGNGITLWNRNVEKAGDYKKIAHIAPNGKITNHEKRQPKEVTAFIEKIAKGMKDKPKNESINEAKGKKAKVASYNVFGSMRELSFNLGKVIDIIDKDPHYRKLSSDLGNFKSVVDKKLKSYQAPLKKVSADTMLESINEGRYHDYRNDESMTPKQKIGRSMREIRDSLTELNRLVKMNVRLKNELKVDSRSYWKNTHKALNKISERLVKLANKVGQLQ